MKKTLLFAFILFSSILFAQVPQGISYQAIATNTNGTPVVSGNISISLSVLDNSASGTVVYTETQTKTTNTQGLFNLVIGQGTATFGTFAAVNWGSNSKFLRVEMDNAGGSNYVLVGTTQLLSVPYAMVAAGIRTNAGQGITLTSPNGTPYTLAVNDAGQLSLPTSNVQGVVPNTYYAYGTFNNYNPATALLMLNVSGTMYGYKYFNSGDEIKFLSSNTAGGAIIGMNANLDLIPNGVPYTFPSNGFYLLQLNNPYNAVPPINKSLNVISFLPKLRTFISASSNFTLISPTYNVANNTLSFVVNGVSLTTFNKFYFEMPSSDNLFGSSFGDNLADGTIDQGGAEISFPNVTATPKNFRVNLILNFNSSGSYTITQI
jgi:hypothetical protein